MCCIKANELENQSEAQHMVCIGFLFLRGESLLDQSGWYGGQPRGSCSPGCRAHRIV